MENVYMCQNVRYFLFLFFLFNFPQGKQIHLNM